MAEISVKIRFRRFETRNVLTSPQIAEFWDRGFLVLGTPQVSRSDIEICHDVLKRLFADGTGRDEGRHFDLIAREGGHDVTSPQILKPSLYSRQLQQFAYRSTGLAVAKQLIGPSASFSGDVAILKPGHIGGPTPWHQDEAFREPIFEYQEIGIWIAITDTGADNGPMSYIPKSHRLGILPHRLQDGAKEANSIECYLGFDESMAVDCPIPAGAIIIHHCRTVHGARANKTTSERLAYVLSYSTPLILRKDSRQFNWQKNLRTTIRGQRRSSLWNGGVVLELYRLMTSGPAAIRSVLGVFFLRRLYRLREFGRSLQAAFTGRR